MKLDDIHPVNATEIYTRLNTLVRTDRLHTHLNVDGRITSTNLRLLPKDLWQVSGDVYSALKWSPTPLLRDVQETYFTRLDRRELRQVCYPRDGLCRSLFYGDVFNEFMCRLLPDVVI